MKQVVLDPQLETHQPPKIQFQKSLVSYAKIAFQSISTLQLRIKEFNLYLLSFMRL